MSDPSRSSDAATTWDGKPAVHSYGGVEHTQPGPIEDCLLCELAALQRSAEEAERFIGHKGLGDEFMEWALAQRAEIDRLLDV